MTQYVKQKIFLSTMKMDKEIKKISAKLGISEAEFMRQAVAEKMERSGVRVTDALLPSDPLALKRLKS